MPPKANTRSTAIKRILQEHKEFLQDPPEDFVAAPLEDDLFDWHVTMKGAEGSDYQGGIYHARLILPPTYPLSPPDIQILTHSGRFETQKNICIDGVTSFHTSSWRPIWGIRTVVVGLGGFWNATGPEAESGYGGLKVGGEERRRLAGISGAYVCPTCARSNRAIMRDHEESMKSKKEDQAKKVETAGSVGEEGEMKGRVVEEVNTEEIGGKEAISIESTGQENVGAVGTRVEKEEFCPSLSPAAQPGVTSATPPTPVDLPALNPTFRALLHPTLSSPLIPSPIKLYLHIVRLLLIPAPTLRAYDHPDKLDWLLVLDTLIWIVGMLVVFVVGAKLGKYLKRVWTTVGSVLFGRSGARAGARAGAGAGTLEAVKRLRRAPNAHANRNAARGGGAGPGGHVHPRRNGVRTGANAGPTQEPGLAVGAGGVATDQEGRGGDVALDADTARLERRANRAVAEEGTGMQAV